MNKLNLNKSSKHIDEPISKKAKRPFCLKQFLLNLVLICVPIILIVTLILTAVFVSRDGFYFSEIKNFRTTWHNSTNNVTEIKQQNSAFSGWINSDDGKFDFPIFSANYKNCSFYIDENCDLENSKNLILHTPKKTNKELNASVLCFKDINFFNRHPSLEVNTDYDKSTYIVFASYYSNNTEFDVYNFNTYDEKTFDESIELLLKSSFLKTNFDINNEDEFLSIILTEKEEEFVVLARKLRKDEEIVFSSSSAKKSTEV